MATSTQWRTAGMDGTPIGLDYVAVDVVRRAYRIRSDPDLWQRLRVLEETAARHLRDERG